MHVCALILKHLISIKGFLWATLFAPQAAEFWWMWEQPHWHLFYYKMYCTDVKAPPIKPAARQTLCSKGSIKMSNCSFYQTKKSILTSSLNVFFSSVLSSLLHCLTESKKCWVEILKLRIDELFSAFFFKIAKLWLYYALTQNTQCFYHPWHWHIQCLMNLQPQEH